MNNNNNMIKQPSERKSFLEFLKKKQEERLQDKVFYNSYGEKKILKGRLDYYNKQIKVHAIENPDFPWSENWNEMFEYFTNKLITSLTRKKSFADLTDKQQDNINNIIGIFSLYWYDGYAKIAESTKEQRRAEWSAECEEEKRKRALDPIKHYAEIIRNEEDRYSLTLEEMEERENEIEDFWHEKADETLESRHNILPKQMTRKGTTREEYRELVRKEIRRKDREEKKQRETDRAIMKTTPYNVIQDKLDSISCDCTAENMRQGIFCETCLLLKKVDSYMLDLFKNAAEGRASFSW